jgi:hypothetical protein
MEKAYGDVLCYSMLQGLDTEIAEVFSIMENGSLRKMADVPNHFNLHLQS